MKKLLLLPLLIVLAPTSAFATDYMVTFDSDLACQEISKIVETEDTDENNYLTCLRVFSYFNSRY